MLGIRFGVGALGTGHLFDHVFPAFARWPVGNAPFLPGDGLSVKKAPGGKMARRKAPFLGSVVKG